MKHLFTLSLLLCPFLTFSQSKELTNDQLKGLAEALTQYDTRFIDWSPENQPIVYTPQKEYQTIDILSGKKQKYISKEKTTISVAVQNGDIVLYNGSQYTSITQTPDMEEQNPTLSPDLKWIAFTRNGNLYTINVASKKESQLTNDGSQTVYNGYASWVYMEEILTRSSRYKAFWWSDDSKKIAFMRFDDTNVPEYTIHHSAGHYGTFEKTRYPKAGDKNPKVKVGIAAPNGGNIIWADFDENQDQYFGLPQWAPDGNLWVRWMPRLQNNMKLFAVNPENGSKKEVYNEVQKTWIEIDDLNKFTFLRKGRQYLALSDQDGWKHIYRYNLNGKLINQITNGEWQVTAIEFVDEKNQKIYFSARKETSTTTDFYVIKFDGSQLRRLTQGNFTHTVSISPNGSYFVDVASNIDTPPFTKIYSIKGKLLQNIGNTKSSNFDQYILPKREIITIPTGDGWKLPAHIIYPINFDRKTPYPVIFKIYGGPNAGTVSNTWKGTTDYWWAKEGIITIEVDHRASGQFGKKGIDYDFKNLGKYDIDDYIEAGKWLKKQTWVANDKLLITGHSYGGYATCMALTKGADVFDYGFAGAPVTSWDLYDSSYTERFMTTPQENPEGYKQGSVLSYIDNYKGFLRISHGDIDDNVHIQNSYQIIDALQKANKKFEFMVYPGSRHGYQHYQRKFDENARAEFYYKHLLNKDIPKSLKD